MEDNEIFIAPEENLKNQMEDAKRVWELAQRLSENGHLSYQETKDLNELSSSIYTRAKAQLKDLYPKYRFLDE